MWPLWMESDIKKKELPETSDKKKGQAWATPGVVFSPARLGNSKGNFLQVDPTHLRSSYKKKKTGLEQEITEGT